MTVTSPPSLASTFVIDLENKCQRGSRQDLHNKDEKRTIRRTLHGKRTSREFPLSTLGIVQSPINKRRLISSDIILKALRPHGLTTSWELERQVKSPVFPNHQMKGPPVQSNSMFAGQGSTAIFGGHFNQTLNNLHDGRGRGEWT